MSKLWMGTNQKNSGSWWFVVPITHELSGFLNDLWFVGFMCFHGGGDAIYSPLLELRQLS